MRQMIFHCENDPDDPDYDPQGRATGWYYTTVQGYPIGPFSSEDEAINAKGQNSPAPRTEA